MAYAPATQQHDSLLLLDNSMQVMTPEPQRGRLWRWFVGTEARASISIFVAVLALGGLLGGVVPIRESDYTGEGNPWKTISWVSGWVYFVAWSVSFYPQVWTNYERKNVEGLSFEYTALNLVGFSCYTAFTTALYWNPEVRAEYAAAHGGSLPDVLPNDVFFAIHAVALTAVVCLQILMYEKGKQRLSLICIVAIVAILLSIGIVTLLTVFKVGAWFTWLNFTTFLSYVKLGITVSKYAPQAWLNWKRKSTVGWTIHNILLDFTGGFLSLGQQVMDCSVTGNFSGIEGNPVKFGLGLTSMVYDIIFMIQHYCLYRHNSAAVAGGAGRSVLGAVNGQSAGKGGKRGGAGAAGGSGQQDEEYLPFIQVTGSAFMREQ